MFFSPDVAPYDFERWYAQMQSESYMLGWDMVLRPPRPDRAHDVPMLVLGARDDAIISEGDLRDTAAAYGVEAEIYSEMAHDMMLEQGWASVADRITEFLDLIEGAALVGEAPDEERHASTG